MARKQTDFETSFLALQEGDVLYNKREWIYHHVAFFLMEIHRKKMKIIHKPQTWIRLKSVSMFRNN
jgi:hypothetical protein